MAEKFITYGGLADLLNSLEDEQEIKLFISKYKKWYISEQHLSKIEAEDRVQKDIKFFLRNFAIKDVLKEKFANAFGVSW